MNSDEDNKETGGEPGKGPRNRAELLWRIGMLVALVAWIAFLISIYEDPGPVCGTGQDKGPC
ncbi:hypothetical protein [Streptomyces sp. NPDC059071]|uniref:hypothetical protein n=1 Tax=unclassified Streptomyces TaxID=2593676 RepID=UPI00365D8023